MKYILLAITIIIFSSIVYLQLKEETPKASTETKISNNTHKENLRANIKNTTIVNSEPRKTLNIQREEEQDYSESKKIEKIPYNDELSLDSDYDPNYNKVEHKLLTEEDFENFEKNSDMVNLAEIDQSELIVSYDKEDENISSDYLSNDTYDVNHNKVTIKELTAEDFETFEDNMPIINDNKEFIEYDDSKFFNEIFSEK